MQPRQITQIGAAGAGILTLIACIPHPPKKLARAEETRALMSAEGCNAEANAPWRTETSKFTLEAHSSGPTCAQAVVILVIRSETGDALWLEKFNAAHNLALSEATDKQAMRGALKSWITQTEAEARTTTSSLPAWGAGQTQPTRGEFPFYVEDGITREDYTALRARNLPMFCYVQGIESEACLALDHGAFIKIGAQSFPG